MPAQFLAFFASVAVMTLGVTIILFLETEMRDEINGISRPLALASPDGGNPKFFRIVESPFHRFVRWVGGWRSTRCGACLTSWWRDLKSDLADNGNYEPLEADSAEVD